MIRILLLKDALIRWLLIYHLDRSPRALRQALLMFGHKILLSDYSLGLRLEALIQNHRTFVCHPNYVSIVNYVAVLVSYLGQLPDFLQQLSVTRIVWTQRLLHPSAWLCTFNIYYSQNSILTRIVTLLACVGTLYLYLLKIYLRHVIRRKLVAWVEWINVSPVQVLGLKVVIVYVFGVELLVGPLGAYLCSPLFELSITWLRSRNILNVHIVLVLHKARCSSERIRLRPRNVICPHSTGRRGVLLLLFGTIWSLIIRALLDTPVVPRAKMLIIPGKLHTVLAGEASSLILRTNAPVLLDLHSLSIN